MEKSFELTADTKYGGTVTNVKRKRVPGGGSSYSKTMRTKACGRTRGTASNTSFNAWRQILCGCWTTSMEQFTSVRHRLLVTSLVASKRVGEGFLLKPCAH